MKKICINTWAGYNEGKAGEWFSWPLSEEEKNTIKNMEESFIVTFEDEYLDSCYFDFEKISVPVFLEICEIYENLEDWQKKAFAAYVEIYGLYALQKLLEDSSFVDDLLLADVSNNYELGVYCIEELDILDIPENLQPYFDYEQYGRDVSFDGSYTEQGFLFDH